MNKVALSVSYNGAPYHGWQCQKGNVRTVQGELEDALSKIANSPIRVGCAGRTDAGVHATNQIVEFSTHSDRDTRAWVYGTNSHLPESISVNCGATVPNNFSARHSAFSRRYLYVIYNSPIRSALLPEYLYREHRPLDHKKMHEAAQFLVGEKDFSSFRASKCQSNTAMRNVLSVKVSREGDLIILDITANAFLLHMVRNIVGVLLDVGAGEKPVSWPRSLLAFKDRSKASKTAPPNGLFLIGVRYEASIHIDIPELVWPQFLGLQR